MTEDKTIQIINNHLTHAQKYMIEHKKDFSSFNMIYNKLIKKVSKDPIFDYTKEIIKRMERDKLTSDSAMQITELLTPEMKNMQKEVLKMAIPLVLGFILLIIFSLLFSFARPFNTDNPFIIYYAIGMFISGLLFGAGLILRTKVKLKTLSKSMLFQAATAYGAAKMQGQGSFAAFRFLEEMKTKQGKELQIRVNQPKIIYK